MVAIDQICKGIARAKRNFKRSVVAFTDEIDSISFESLTQIVVEAMTARDMSTPPIELRASSGSCFGKAAGST